jgi:glyoxylase-like metal-dependent hydrolase (beta-lactamase superfamily II)
MSFRNFFGLLLLATVVLLPACRSTSPTSIRAMEPPPFDAARAHQHDFTPTGDLKQLSENLYLFEDSCNVYIIKHGTRATLVDFGTGDVLRALPRIGVAKVERVLVTHHHRDQVQGLADLNDYEFLVTVPKEEARFFEDLESFWNKVKIYINYDLRSYWNTLRHSVKVSEKVSGGNVIDWNGIQFRVLDTPGHTDHSVSYSARIDGRQVVFTGDLIAGKGKVTNWYDLHWAYYGFTQGINASDRSFELVRAEKPEWLLPSHGDPIKEPEAAMQENSRIYSVLRDMLPPNSAGRSSGEMRHILPHLIHIGGPPQQSNGYMTSYAILSDNGNALIYDYGYVDLEHIQKLKRKLGIKHVTVTFSHYHDDHLIRVYELLRDGDLNVWVYENMVDILENPTRYRLPCLIPFPITADRVLHDGERIEWNGYTLEFFHMPGQTEFHQGLVTMIDGKKVMFTGDNTWKKRDPQKVRNGPLVPQNEYFLDGGFITCAKKMLHYLPDIVCPAHTDEYSPSKEDLEQFLGWSYKLRDVMTDLILQPDPNFGMDYRWCHFYPFRHVAREAEEFQVELIIRNHLFRPGKIQVALKHSGDLACSNPVRTVTMEPKSQVAIPFLLRRTGGFGQRTVVTADVTFNGRRLGEVAELLID